MQATEQTLSGTNATLGSEGSPSTPMRGRVVAMHRLERGLICGDGPLDFHELLLTKVWMSGEFFVYKADGKIGRDRVTVLEAGPLHLEADARAFLARLRDTLLSDPTLDEVKVAGPGREPERGAGAAPANPAAMATPAAEPGRARAKTKRAVRAQRRKPATKARTRTASGLAKAALRRKRRR